MKIINIIKNSPFKSLKKKYYLGKLVHGTPYFYPRGFSSSIIEIKKLKLTNSDILKNKNKKFSNLPLIRRSKNWTINIFNNYYYIEIGTPIIYHTNELGWKDKYDTPRFEWSPAFFILFFNWQFCIWWIAPVKNQDLYWEMFLWWKYYSNENIIKAKEDWSWCNYEDKISTWDDNNLKEIKI
jgi:hypothetical protein